MCCLNTSTNTNVASNVAPLEGEELLARYQTLLEQGLSHSQIAVECGYYTVIQGEGPRKGQVRSASAALNIALLQAQGVPAAPVGRPSAGPRTKSGARYSVVTGKGRCSISGTMLEKLGAGPGSVIDWGVENGRLIGTVSQAAPSEQFSASSTQAPVPVAV